MAVKSLLLLYRQARITFYVSWKKDSTELDWHEGEKIIENFCLGDILLKQLKGIDLQDLNFLQSFQVLCD